MEARRSLSMTATTVFTAVGAITIMAPRAMHGGPGYKLIAEGEKPAYPTVLRFEQHGLPEIIPDTQSGKRIYKRWVPKQEGSGADR